MSYWVLGDIDGKTAFYNLDQFRSLRVEKTCNPETKEPTGFGIVGVQTADHGVLILPASTLESAQETLKALIDRMNGNNLDD